MNQGYNNIPQNNNGQNYNNPVNNTPMNGMPANNNLQASNIPVGQPVNSNEVQNNQNLNTQIQQQFQNTVVNTLEDGTQVYLDGTKVLKDGTKILPNGEKYLANGIKIVDTSSGKENGQNKCPKCGATDVKLIESKGVLVCTYCRYEFKPEQVSGMVKDISKLEGQIMGTGATDIQASVNDQITIKCSSCGAEVVIDSSETVNARCHWCRNTLSLNQQIPNGAVPDLVLPFHIKKEEARAEIEKFVGKRKFYAHPKFVQEFNTQNIIGVYFPYMLVDVNAHSNLVGQGEHEVRRYTVSTGNNSSETRYDADLYNVVRDFDITISGLTVESNLDRLNNGAQDKTNNIINSIMPFDTENAVKYNAGFLKGYSSEKRNLNVEQLRNIVYQQSKDIARFAANDTLKQYDRGVAWSSENFTLKGQQWQAAYLPVWLYSYQEVKGDKKLLHYVAVNARTKETMGSVPLHIPKLIFVSAIIEILSFIFVLFVDFDMEWLFLLSGFVYYFIIYSKYRNKNARHTYEKETKRQMSNISGRDDFVKREKGLSNSRINGANNTVVSAKSFGGITANGNITFLSKK